MNRRRNIFRIVIVCAVSAVVLEAASRYYLGQVKRRGGISAVDRMLQTREMQMFDNNVLHPYLGFVNDYGAKDRSVNEYGFRGMSPLAPVSLDSVRIGVFGGSVAQTLCYRYGEMLKDEMAKYKRFKGKKIELVSIALGGFKQPQPLEALAYFLALGAHFDIVCTIDGFNEVALPYAENVPDEVAYHYPRKWHALTRQAFNITTLKKIYRFEHISLHKRRMEEWSKEWPVRHSSTLRLTFACLIDYYGSRQRREIDRIVRMLADAPKPYQSTGPLITYRDDSEVFTLCVSLWQNASRQMARLCKANGIEYFHFLQPNQYYSKKPFSEQEQKMRIYSENSLYRYPVEKAYPLLKEKGRELQQEDVRFYDLSSLFDQELRDTYADNCCHYTMLGNHILAARIASEINEHYSKRSSDAP
jgi:hypothetical protein